MANMFDMSTKRFGSNSLESLIEKLLNPIGISSKRQQDEQHRADQELQDQRTADDRAYAEELNKNKYVDLVEGAQRAGLNPEVAMGSGGVAGPAPIQSQAAPKRDNNDMTMMIMNMMMLFLLKGTGGFSASALKSANTPSKVARLAKKGT